MKDMSRRTNPVLMVLSIVFLFMTKTWAGTPGELTHASSQNNKFVLSAENARTEIQFLEKGVIRIEIVVPGREANPESFMTVPGALQNVAFEHKADLKELWTKDVGVKYSVNPNSLSFLDRSGNTLLRLDGEGAAWEKDGSYRLTFKKEAGDRYFGLGEPFAGLEAFDGKGAWGKFTKPILLNQIGQKRLIWNKHFPRPSEMGLPFLINPRGYGLLVENPWRSVFDFTPSGAFEYSADGGPMIFYFFASQSMYEILDAYSQLTGRTPMPPAWVTGYMQCRFGYASESEFRWLMDNFRSRQIPADTLIFDLDWYAYGPNDIRMGDLQWSPAHFPNAIAFQKELHDRGFKSITIIEPQIWRSSANFQEVFAQNLVSQNRAGEPFLFKHWTTHDAILLDFLNPQAREWFGARVMAIHETGVDGWWTDLNEPEDDRRGMIYSNQPDQAAHNIQALLMHRALAEMYEKIFPEQRLFIMSRAGFIGDWRYGVGIWSGDVNSSWTHLRNQVPIGISASLSGYGFWNSDTGGFHNVPSPELYTRWMQFSAFCPIYRAHGDHSIREPWAFGEKTEKDVKKIMELRYRLSPYHYTTFYEMHQQGRPPMRAMFLEFPDDQKTYDLTDQYMYGPWLLVAPVTRQGASSREVYVPAGRWTNYWTEAIITGPQKIKMDAPIDRIPLLVREGAVVPMMPWMQFIGEKPMDPVTIHIYPSEQPSTYAIYNDDGSSNQYLKGEFALLPVEVIPGKSVQIKVGPRQGGFSGMTASLSYLVVYHHCGSPVEISVDHQVAGRSNQDLEYISTLEPIWSYDPVLKILKILVPKREGFSATIAAASN